MPCLCAIAGAIPPDYVDASYSSHTEKKASVDAEGNFDPKPVETTKWARKIHSRREIIHRSQKKIFTFITFIHSFCLNMFL